MKITIKKTNLELTPQIRDLINKKIGGLEKFINLSETVAEAWVEIGRTTLHHKSGEIFRTEVQIHLPGKSIRAESVAKDLIIAINEVKDILQRELKQYKMKIIAKRRRGIKKLKSY